MPTDWITDPDYLSPWLEPDYVPGPSDPGAVLFGANPGWSPDREVSPERREHCPRCGRVRLYDGLAEHLIETGEDKVCASCQDWGRDDWLAGRMLREVATRGDCGPILRPVVDPRRQAQADRREWGENTRTATFHFDAEGNPVRCQP